MEKIKDFIKENPHYFAIFFLFMGIGGLICAIIDANWLFGNINRLSYNFKTIDGLVNFFGRKTARIVFGGFSIAVIIGGIFWFWAFGYYYKNK